jgi:SAM-dependent methyltransferase
MTPDRKAENRPAWMIDELRHAGPEHLETGYVEGYDRRAQFDPEPDIELLIERGLSAESTVVDFGAGTGTFAIAAADRCSQVIAVEPSTAMLEVLRAKAVTAGRGNVLPVRAGFLSYEHRGPLADFAYSRNALHHLPDFWKALALTRVAAVLKPGGVLYMRDIVYSFEIADTARAIEAWTRRGVESAADGWTPDELAEHVRQEHSTFSWLLEAALDRAGFETLDASFSESKVFAAYLCTKR